MLVDEIKVLLTPYAEWEGLEHDLGRIRARSELICCTALAPRTLDQAFEIFRYKAN